MEKSVVMREEFKVGGAPISAPGRVEISQVNESSQILEPREKTATNVGPHVGPIA